MPLSLLPMRECHIFVSSNIVDLPSKLERTEQVRKEIDTRANLSKNLSPLTGFMYLRSSTNSLFLPGWIRLDAF